MGVVFFAGFMFLLLVFCCIITCRAASVRGYCKRGDGVS